MEILKVDEPEKLESELMRFVFRIYQSTNGKYPALEWVDRKPSVDDFEGFSRVYRPFLKFRLGEEFDELYIVKDKENIVGTVALVYNLKGKNIWWIPDDLKESEAVGLIEFFMVDEKYRGKGIGGKLLTIAIERLRKIGKVPHVVTFPNLKAYEYYLKRGFKEIMRFGEFAILKLE
ncbi:GNAT family N-acetyltransferase [Pyrococcus sp. ST04]|uniref:GNAT family N-acetyltransferase n=1 Tax=Pyrococcus sp. ST04 TaxID=1183377 RepID=UPI0002605B7D|nr:GNAT family N-acetyltransferase [Pyrococcus sp. ST04]AFK22865.1 putative GNAT family N-acetyltransferase [Pyrococcus sp. ST04]